MNRRTGALAGVLAAIAGLAADGALGQTPLGTAFTYQGELRQSGAPSAAPADFRFRLYTADAGGVLVPGTVEVTRNSVALSNGRFAVALDFGPSAFGSEARWLEIDVRSPAGSGSFLTLTPRQRITVAPVARYSFEAGTAATAAAAANATLLGGENSAFYTNAANMSSGTLPAARLSGTYGNELSLTNAGNSFAGSGAGLTALNASSLATGTIADARLSSTVALRNVANAFTASGNTFTGFVGIGRGTPVTGADVLAVRSAGTGGWGGMYVETAGSGERPFYGYATDGIARAWHYYEGSTGTWHLDNNGTRLSVTSTGSVGVGTGAPQALLHVQGGSAGSVAHGESIGVLEGSTTGYLSILTPSTTERGILFGDETNNVRGGIIYNHAATPNGMQFRTGGNATRMSIGAEGRVTIGAEFFSNVLLTVSNPVDGESGLFSRAIGAGRAITATCVSPQGYAGVFSGHLHVINGNYSVSNGFKFFRIDHPDDPENKYLHHICVESPDPLNSYSGTVTLGADGAAVVDLPAYFAKINTDPRYSLTPIGAPMPMLHVAEEISAAAMAGGHVCSFRIGGGVPGARVSWRIEAVRNDPWTRDHAAPIEVDKPEHEKGTYLYPAGYGQPESRGFDFGRFDPAMPGAGSP